MSARRKAQIADAALQTVPGLFGSVVFIACGALMGFITF